MQVKEKCNMAHVIRAIDGKHIRVKCPKLTASQYFNSKGFFSIVLLGICDASYCFVLFDLGQYVSEIKFTIGSTQELGIMENCFGTLYSRWRIFNKPIKVSIHK